MTASLRSFEQSQLAWINEQTVFTDKEFLLNLMRYKEDLLKESSVHSNKRDETYAKFVEYVTQKYAERKQNGFDQMLKYFADIDAEKTRFIAHSFESEMKQKFLRENTEQMALSALKFNERVAVLESDLQTTSKELKSMIEWKQDIKLSVSAVCTQMNAILAKFQVMDEQMSRVEQQNLEYSSKLKELKDTCQQRDEEVVVKLNSDFHSLVEAPLKQFVELNSKIVDNVRALQF